MKDMKYLDPFTRKKVLGIVDGTNKDNEALMVELAKEFGLRLGYAVQQGIPRGIAFEACRTNFRRTGEMMIMIANSVSYETAGGDEAFPVKP